MSIDGARRRHGHRMHAKIGHEQVAQQEATVGVRIGAHPPGALGRKLGQFGDQPPTFVEQLLGLVALHPTFELRNVFGMLGIDEERHLVRPEGSLDLKPIDDLRPRPALGRSQDDHRPARPGGVLGGPRGALEPPDVRDGAFQNGGHQFVHLRRIVALDEVGCPAASAEELVQFLMPDAGQHGRVADLVAVQMQDRQHGTVGHGIEELVGLPCGRQGAGFRFAIADDTGDDQIRIVERGAKGMAEGVAQFAAFVDRTRRRRRNMTRNTARKRKLGEQLLQAGFVLTDIRVDFTVGAFKIGVRHQRRPAVTGTGDVEHVQVMLFDDPVQVDIDEVLTWCCAPVSHHQRLHVGHRQRLAQKRVVIEINLSDGEVVGRPPVGVHPPQLVGTQRLLFVGSGRRAALIPKLSR